MGVVVEVKGQKDNDLPMPEACLIIAINNRSGYTLSILRAYDIDFAGCLQKNSLTIV